MNVDTFLDTNVFVYLFDESAPAKRSRATELVRTALSEGSACVSFQVVQETLNVITQKLEVPVSLEDARDLLRETLAPLWRVLPTEALYAKALDVKDRYGYSFYDALILAAALDAGCTRLLSEDLQDGQRIDGLRIENPFWD